MSDDLLQILTEQSKAIGRIESSLQLLVGNGQPGLIKEMRDDIETLKTARNYGAGFAAGLVFVEGAFHLILHKLGVR